MKCFVDIRNLKESDFKCGSCNICSEDYKDRIGNFKDDLNNARAFENELKDYVMSRTGLDFVESKNYKNADLAFSKRGQLICRVEAKLLNGKAPVFMKKIVGLEGKEMLVVDEPKFEHYVKKSEEDNLSNFAINIPTFVVWQFNRPCEDFGGITVFQDLNKLKSSIEANPKRKFERKTNEKDIQDGIKLGVTKKFHFSISETEPIWRLTESIFVAINEYENVLDEIIEAVVKIQELYSVIDNFDKELVKLSLTKYIQLYGKDRLIKTFLKISDDLKDSERKYFTFSILLDKTKIHDRVKRYS